MSCKVNRSFYVDIEINNLIASMNRGITSYSLSETKKIIHCPTTDTLLLKKRQSYIREFL